MGKIKDNYDCSLDLTMDLIGGKWKLRILWYLMDGTKRFSELKAYIPSVTQKVLTEQLRELEEANIISRKVYAVVPPKVEYTMTEYGISLIPILKDLCNFATNYAINNDITLN
ncbi:MAG: winged helix-turn-helix transcriptional regulator [Clostridium sp.]